METHAIGNEEPHRVERDDDELATNNLAGEVAFGQEELVLGRRQKAMPSVVKGVKHVRRSGPLRVVHADICRVSWSDYAKACHYCRR